MIVHISDYRDKPDPAQVQPDQWGRPTYRFIAEYQHKGRTWACDIWAFDMVDAEDRAAAIGNVRLLGQVYEEGTL